MDINPIKDRVFFMDYEAAVEWVDGFHQFGIQLGLNRIEKALNALDNPQEKVDFVHVAGTNGKGSVCRFISSILTTEGYKTGLYLSPHLIDFCERFQINDTLISKQRFVDIVTQVQPTIDQLANDGVQLTYFEVCTIIAFVFFVEEKVDYAIVEVGLGGRYDATNVITPLVSIITNVSLDHQQQLGDTIEKIAFEKSGIIKPGIPVVTAATDPAITVIKKTCELLDCSVSVVSNKTFEIVESSSVSQTVFVHGIFNEYTVTTQMIGSYQPMNVALSILAIELLQERGVFVTKESIIEGIQEMNHPGRMQILQDHPFVIVDGAHNPKAMNQVVLSVRNFFTFNRLILIFGVMKDKAIREMLKELLPITDFVIITKPNQKRSAPSEDIKNLISELDKRKQKLVTHTVNEAYQKAIELANDDDLILGTGSLFTVGEILKIYDEK